MTNLSRRDFVVSASAATLATAAFPATDLAAAALPTVSLRAGQRIFVGSGTADGILAFDWDAATGELTAAGVAAKLTNVDWITYSHDRKFLYAASEVDSFNGKPTGGVVGFVVEGGTASGIATEFGRARVRAISRSIEQAGCWCRRTTAAAALRRFRWRAVR